MKLAMDKPITTTDMKYVATGAAILSTEGGAVFVFLASPLVIPAPSLASPLVIPAPTSASCTAIFTSIFTQALDVLSSNPHRFFPFSNHTVSSWGEKKREKREKEKRTPLGRVLFACVSEYHTDGEGADLHQ
jgi:hypothetical protein